MAALLTMPPIIVSEAELQPFGQRWQEKQSLPRTPPFSSTQLGNVFDSRIGQALAALLGGVKVVTPNQFSIRPAEDDVVEVGPVRIVGGVRPQNFDVGYRPDGVRFAFDSKTLNDLKSVRKNYQNMINDLGTEATTVHIRFPYAVVAFMVVIPEPCLLSAQRLALTRTLERLSGRIGPIDSAHKAEAISLVPGSIARRGEGYRDSAHKAEAISLVLWNPLDGKIDVGWPVSGSPLRIEALSQQIEHHYVERYKGLPPHDVDEPAVEAESEAEQETSDPT